MFHKKIDVLMSTVFDATMLKGGSQEKRDRREECKMEEAGAVRTPCFPPKWSVIKYAAKLSFTEASNVNSTCLMV